MHISLYMRAPEKNKWMKLEVLRFVVTALVSTVRGLSFWNYVRRFTGQQEKVKTFLFLVKNQDKTLRIVFLKR